ncbi:MAG: response regulator transcription factor [Planctomycetes bacterium]|nr:response regulator transcription factor [Planctomycetota bacterium]
MKILIVDDDPKLRGFVAKGLEAHGIASISASDGNEALSVLDAATERPDLILLDVMMPGKSGLEFLEELRRRGSDIPVIFVTARRGVEDRVKGLRTGADDYILKPFEFDELLARIEAVVRRRRSVPVFEFGDLRIDATRRIVERGNERIDLSPKEFDLLRMLAEAKGRTVTRTELLKVVWGINFDPETNVVDALVARLRRRVDRHGTPLIETVVGEGYRLAPIRERR